jgi:hypothetical protein
MLACMDETEMHRLRALQCEQRAHGATDPLTKAEWKALAIEWHSLANAIARSSGEDDQVDFA